MEIAQEVGGTSHHFKYIESPFNLAKPHAYNYSNQKGPDGKYYTLMQAAQGYGLNLLASSSLLQMNLFKGPFDQKITEALGTPELTDIITALQFARSGNILSALFGAVNPQHVEENLMLAYVEASKHEDVKSLFEA
jgi:diketogulonate reductase-like aldo/keto reductase